MNTLKPQRSWMLSRCNILHKKRVSCSENIECRSRGEQSFSISFSGLFILGPCYL